ncbi:MAG TPA: 50S ribosomal protein L18e [Candidatus Nanoarchaeia archaeon]|nr:50S ribosomal protein L18e [Candidatus Nanoarchaeia archaeon]
MISKTRIKERARKKTNSFAADSIMHAAKNKAWLAIAQRLSASTRLYASVNLEHINRLATAGDTVVVPGKVLGTGDITKKLRVCALGFSASAREKLKKAKSEIVSISEEIRKNPKAEGIKIIQ